jgi:nicotinamide-nucleotide amidase
VGTAPGLFWDITDRLASLDWIDNRPAGPCLMMAMPGVPREMKKMWIEELVPRLQSYQPNTGILVSQSLKFFGIGESRLAEMLSDLMALTSPTVSPYVGEADVRIRMAVRADTIEAGLAQLAPIKAAILERTHQYAIGENADILESLVGEHLKQKGLTIAVAESCTGGLVSSRLTDIPGSSDYVKLNVVTYSNDAKAQLLKVDPQLITQYGAVSEEVAIAMADGVQRLSGSDMGLSLTGIAGPTGGSDEKPVGLVYIGLAQTGYPTQAFKALVNPKYERSYIKYWFSQYALYYAYQRLSEVSSHVVQTLT